MMLLKKGKVGKPSFLIRSSNKNESEDDKKLNRNFYAWYRNHKNEYSSKDAAYNDYINNIKIDNSIVIADCKYNSFRHMCLANNIHPDTIKNFLNTDKLKK